MMQMSYFYAKACFKKNSSLHISTEINISLMTFHTQKPLKNYISSVKKSFDPFLDVYHKTLFPIPVTKSSVSSFYFFIIHHCKHSFSLMHIFVHHCTFCASLHVKTSYSWEDEAPRCGLASRFFISPTYENEVHFSLNCLIRRIRNNIAEILSTSVFI